ncbi:MAG: mechanosensitive ion channel family protein [Trueperella sp.]|nr:mechanosensitive ion channel family protein [Trueperella sp.]
MIVQILRENGAPADAGEAVEATFDALQLGLGALVGAGIGLVLGLAILGVMRVFARRRPAWNSFNAPVAKPLEILMMAIGAWIGFTTQSVAVHSEAAPAWLPKLDHLFLILVIVLATWLIAAMVNGLVQFLYARIENETEPRRTARIKTQMQILHRVAIATVWVLGVAAVLLTFPGARAAGTSLFASAGIISVVAGLAAQTTLGNVFAGLQLAFSDSLRVGDIVQYDGEYTTVEEITLTYVVLAVWDGRRIIVPSVKMTTESFENWTRRAPEMLGGVEWLVDWGFPIDAARKQLDYLLRETDLWDGRTGVLQVVDSVEHDGLLKIRALISAADSPTLTDLAYYVRESMVKWIQEEAPQAVPHQRLYRHAELDFTAASERSSELVEQRLAQEPPTFTPQHKVPRKTEKHTAATEIITSRDIGRDSIPISRVPLAELAANIPDSAFESEIPGAPTGERTAGHESAIFSGSAQAEELAKQYSGPGEEVYEERNRKLTETEEALVANSTENKEAKND